MSEQKAKGDGSKEVTINRPRLSSENSPEYKTPVGSPSQQHLFLVPSPFVTRRERTYSASGRATVGPLMRGDCVFFSRTKGHGFIRPQGTEDEDKYGKLLFMHISDIESEYVPLPGDKVTYKLSKIPPKMEKYQAVEVNIVGLDTSSGKCHETWENATSK